VDDGPEVIGPDLWAVVAANPRRRPDNNPRGPNWADFDRAVADDALALGVCNLARAKIGLPPTE
jgi:hypothetical protein